MKYLVLCFTLYSLFFINTVFSSVTLKAKYEDEEKKSVTFKYKHNLALQCNLTSSDDDVTIKWEREGVELEKIEALKGRVVTKQKGTLHLLYVQHTVEDDAGNYSCVAYENDIKVDQADIIVSAQIAVKVQGNINVIEGEKLRIHCNVIGRPSPTLTWTYHNDTYNTTYTESKDRVILEEDSEKKIPNSILRIEVVEMFDRGVFTCIGASPLLSTPEVSTCMVRVKDKYAALWPFLGICAEVFILCAIIFIYEKKRNKTELEESDTDQSPDQKNTPDHGKDTNLRHRQ